MLGSLAAVYIPLIVTGAADADPVLEEPAALLGTLTEAWHSREPLVQLAKAYMQGPHVSGDARCCPCVCVVCLSLLGGARRLWRSHSSRGMATACT